MKQSGIEIMTRLLLARPSAGKENIMAIPIIDMVRTGQNINRLRKAAGISVKDLQDIFGFGTPQAIYKWQHGTALPTIDNLVVLAAVLGVKVDDVLVMTDTNMTVSA
jgi:ribosome-binding protein aMBF1 (putative translation factor)